MATVIEPLTGLLEGTTYHYRWTATSDGGTKIAISKPATGRRQSGTCKALTKKNAKGKKCTFDRAVTTVSQTHTAGRVSILFDGTVAKKKLAAGTYKAAITVTTSEGSVSPPVVLSFKIKRN